MANNNPRDYNEIRAKIRSTASESEKSALALSEVIKDNFNISEDDLINLPLVQELGTDGLRIVLGHLAGVQNRRLAEIFGCAAQTITRVLKSVPAKSLIAQIQSSAIDHTRARIYASLDLAMDAIETILRSPKASNADKLKAATILLDKALPTMATPQELELASDQDVQQIYSDRMTHLIERMIQLNGTGKTLTTVERFNNEETEQTLEALSKAVL